LLAPPSTAQPSVLLPESSSAAALDTHGLPHIRREAGG